MKKLASIILSVTIALNSVISSSAEFGESTVVQESLEQTVESDSSENTSETEELTTEIEEASDSQETEDLIVSADKIIYYDTVVNNLSVTKGTLDLNGNNLIAETINFTGGTIDLNGGTLTVTGDVSQSAGIMKINGGRLLVNGDYSITAFPSCYGQLDMTAPKSYVLVSGDFTTKSMYSHNGKLTEGILEVKGNFTQLTSGYDSNFYATNNHKVILSGEEKQKVSFQSINCRFASLELQNYSEEGVEFSITVPVDNFIANDCKYTYADGSRVGWVLESDEEINGDLTLSGGTLDLNGNTLIVNGNLTHTDGEVFINNGSLIVNGDYKIQTADQKNSNGTLNMTNEADVVTVSGDFIMQSCKSHNDLLTEGTLTVGGDFTQNVGSAFNFFPSGNHTTVLNGTDIQTVSISSSSLGYANFNNFKMENTSTYGIVFKQKVFVTGMLMNTESVFDEDNLYISTGAVIENGIWNTDLNIIGSVTLTSDLSINGNLNLRGGLLDLNGNKLTVNGDVINASATIKINGGQFIINGDCSIIAQLDMTVPESYILVNGDFTVKSGYTYKDKLTEGILEIKGDFTQLTNGYDSNFYATKNHKVVLSGEEKQNVSFQSISCRFASLELQNYSEEGVEFSITIPVDNFIPNDCKYAYADGSRTGWTLETDEEINGDLTLSGGILDLNGNTLIINGNLTHTDGEIFINNGSLVVNGDYKIQTADQKNSNGTLNMTNEADTVTVSGNFVMQSSKSHKELLSEGILTVSGDFSQNNCSNYNYYTSGNHTTVLNGTGIQTVSMLSSSTSYARFNNFKMENTSTDGIIFKQNVFVTGMLMNTESVFDKDKLYISTGAVIENGTWNTDLNINGNVTLTSDLSINGNLNLRGGLLDLNGNKLTVNGDVINIVGTLAVNGGQLIVNGDYYNENTSAPCYGQLDMTVPESYILVNGDFIVKSLYNHNGKLTEGILEVKGNFTQLTNGSDSNFYATENHKVILSGEQKQIVSFASENSQFNILEITKSIENGYEFSRTPLWNELIERDTDTVAPTKPLNLKAETVTTFSVELKWNESTDNIAVSGYYVYCNGVKVGDVKTPRFIHENLTSDTIYRYYICAYDVEQNLSPKSDELIISTLSITDAPAAPTNLKAQITDEGIKITWTVSVSSNLTEYRIYRDGAVIGTTTGVSYLDEDKERGMYVYYVRACDDAGNLSNITESITVDNAPPPAPYLSLEEISDTSVKLIWTSTSSDTDYFEVYKNNAFFAKTSANSLTDYNLSVSELYEYYVIAYDTSKNVSEASETIVFCTNDDENPVVVSITPSSDKCSGEIKVTVSTKDNVAVSSIVLQASQDKTNWQDVANYNATYYKKALLQSFTLDTSLYHNGTLYLRALVYDTSKNASNPDTDIVKEISINNTKPQRPEPISLELNDGYIEVSWRYPDPDTQYFKLYRSNGEEFELIRDNYKYNNYFEDGMKVGVRFSYYVTAVNSYGCESVPSDTVEIFIEEDDTLPEVLSVYPPSGKSISENQKISVSCKDNFMLKGVSVKLGKYDSDELSEIYYGELTDYHDIIDFELDTTNLEDGKYKLQFTAIDDYGNESKPYTLMYNYKSCKLSEPQLTALGKGWRNDLSWTIENSEDLAGYIIYRRDLYYGSYQVVDRITGTSYSDGQVTAGKQYWYVIGAVDSRNNIVLGPEVSVTPLDEDDILPTACAGIDLYTVAGKEVQFDGTKSFDNRNRIASYEWDFGDGSSGTGSKAAHSYSEEGIYTATLKVTDSSGNIHKDTATVTVRDNSFCMAEFNIVSEGGIRLSNVMVYCENNGVASETYYSDSKGKVTIFALPGTYDVYFCRDGYLPVHKEIDVTDDMSIVSVVLEEKELITGELTVKELNLAEMKALNIDVYAPENQHVFEYTTTIERKEEGGIEALVFYVNKAGELVNSEQSYTFTDSEGRTSKMFVHILTDEEFAEIESMPTIAVLTITAGFSWTKEFFDVELTVINNATEEFSIENSFATLNIPDGLSIADTYLGTELTRPMGTISGGSSKSISWIVRGDKAGEYNLSADFCGTLMPFNKNVTAVFETKEPLIVEAGEALHFEEVRGMIEDWEHWSITYKLTNVSDNTIYGITASVGGYIGFGNINDVMIVYPNGRIVFLAWNKDTEEYIEEEVYFDALNYAEDDGRDYLEPGESVIIYLTLDLELTEE